MKLFFKLLALIVLLCAGAAGFAAYEGYRFLHTPPEQPGRECVFDVAPGDSMRAVAVRLEKQGLISNELYFRLLARYKKWEHRMQAGRFALNSGWTPEQILDTLVNGHPILFRVTVREGLTWWQTGKLLEAAGFVRFEDFRAVVLDKDFLRKYGIPFASAEGFLMPDTYLIRKDDAPDMDSARSVAGRLVDNFWRKAATRWPGGQKPASDELKRLVILASVVEKETAIDSERARVAGVYANRLKRNMLLQADPTVIYGLGAGFEGIGHELAYLFPVLVGNKAHADLGMGGGGKDGLGSFSGITAPHPVHVQGGTDAGAFQGGIAFLAAHFFYVEGFLVFFFAEGGFGHGGTLFLGDLQHIVVEAGNSDVTVLVDKVGDKLGQDIGGIGHSTAEKAGMEILVGAGDADFDIAQAAKPYGDGGNFRGNHRGVGNQNHVGFEHFLVVGAPFA